MALRIRFVLIACLAVKVTALSQSKREDDPPALEVMVTRMSQELESLQAKFSALSSSHGALTQEVEQLKAAGDRVGFSASTTRRIGSTANTILPFESVHVNAGADGERVGFSASTTRRIGSTANTILPFESVHVNAGGGYNQNTGVFTVPRTGLYFFTITLDVSTDFNWVSVRRNGHEFMEADKDDSTSSVVTGSALVELQESDVVAVYHVQNSGTVDQGIENMFTGFLVK